MKLLYITVKIFAFAACGRVKAKFLMCDRDGNEKIGAKSGFSKVPKPEVELKPARSLSPARSSC